MTQYQLLVKILREKQQDAVDQIMQGLSHEEYVRMIGYVRAMDVAINEVRDAEARAMREE